MVIASYLFDVSPYGVEVLPSPQPSPLQEEGWGEGRTSTP